MLEVVEQIASDYKERAEDYAVADGVGGFNMYEEGGLRLAGAGDGVIVEATVNADQVITSLVPPGSAAIGAAVVEWEGSAVEHYEIWSATARLNPDTGGGQEVTHWVAQLYRVTDMFRGDEAQGVPSTQRIWRIAPISFPIVVAAGVTTADVPFTFASGYGVPTIGPTGEGLSKPLTLMFVWALKAGNEPAANAAWMGDSGDSGVSYGGHSAMRYDLVRDASPNAGSLDYIVGDAPINGLPAFALRGQSYSSSSLEWTTFPLDLGVAPSVGTSLEIVVEYAAPSDTEVTVELDDGGGYVEVLNGDRVGEDRTAYGGSDLSAMNRQQTYDLKLTLTASSDGLKTPRVFRVGIREVSAQEVDSRELVTFESAGWAIDPFSCQSEIPTLSITLHRDGVRDYRSWAEELFATNYVNQIMLRVRIGHPDLARQHWLHVDDFIIERYDPTGDGIHVEAVSPLKYAAAELPPKVGSVREIIEYENEDLRAIEDDLISGQIGVASQYVGPGITDQYTLASRLIKEVRAGLEVLQEVHFLDGSVKISSQGQLKTVRLFDDVPPEGDAFFPMSATQVTGFDAGLDKRITSIDVPYGWDDQLQEYTGERTSAASATIVANLGQAIARKTTLDDRFARWIPDSTLADTIGARLCKHFGVGIPRLRFISLEPRPQLEPGDPAVVEQDRYVGRDPVTGDPLRGRLWAIGRIVHCGDALGTDFTLWVQAWVNFLPTAAAVSRVGFVRALAPLESDTSSDSVTGTVVETTLKTHVIPGRLLGPAGGFIYEVVVDIGGTNNAKTVRIKYGGTTVATAVFISSETGKSRIRVEVRNTSRTSQRIIGELKKGAANSITVDDVSIDTEQDQNLIVTGELANGSDSIEIEDSVVRFFGTG